MNKFILVLALLIPALVTYSQGQIDKKEVGFADYLFQLKQYDFAAEEYERLYYNQPDSLVYLSKLVKTYRLRGGLHTLSNRLIDREFTDKDIFKSYFKLLISNSFSTEANELLDSNGDFFTPIESQELYFNLALAEQKWFNAIELYNQSSEGLGRYRELVGNISNRSYKSPTKAALLSTIVPGAGRAYAKDYKDGIISFVFVLAAAVQSYQRFKKNGVSSIGGWIYGGFALGFHVSNIYGSYRSAQYYNNKINKTLYDQSLYYINSDLY